MLSKGVIWAILLILILCPLMYIMRTVVDTNPKSSMNDFYVPPSSPPDGEAPFPTLVDIRKQRAEIYKVALGSTSTPEEISNYQMGTHHFNVNLKVPKEDCSLKTRLCSTREDCIERLCDRNKLPINSQFNCVNWPNHGSIKRCTIEMVKPNESQERACPERDGFYPVLVQTTFGESFWRCYNTKPNKYKDDGSVQPWVCGGKDMDPCVCDPPLELWYNENNPERTAVCAPPNSNLIFPSFRKLAV